jgi:hypothetical protein
LALLALLARQADQLAQLVLLALLAHKVKALLLKALFLLLVIYQLRETHRAILTSLHQMATCIHGLVLFGLMLALSLAQQALQAALALLVRQERPQLL